MVLRDLAEGLWHETDQPPPDLPPERFRAWVDARDREVRTRETPSFRTVEIPVDGRRVPFDYLAIGSAWVARGSVGQVTLTLVGRNLDVSGLELVTVTDAEPYIRGTRQFHDELSDDAD